MSARMQIRKIDSRWSWTCSEHRPQVWRDKHMMGDQGRDGACAAAECHWEGFHGQVGVKA